MIKKVVIPKKEELKLQRAINIKDLQPNLDDWNGLLGEDNKGIYTYAKKYIPNKLLPIKGEKIYIDDFYNFLEEKIIFYYKKADSLLKEVNDNFKVVFSLMHLESILIVLLRLHSNPHEDLFLTNTEVEDLIIKESSLEEYVDYINSINILKVNTPLGVGTLMKQMFKETFDKIYISNPNLSLEDLGNRNKYLN